VGAPERRPADAPWNFEPRGASPTLLSHLGVLARRKWVVLVALVITPVVALVIALRQTPLYQGTAEVLLNHQNLAASVSGVPDSNADPVRVAQTQADLARVPEVARRTLAAAGIHDRTALDFLTASSVSTTVNADLLTFDVSDRDPAVATRLATEYARQFVAFRNELDSAAFDRARKGIERRLDQLRAAGATGSPLFIDLTAKRQQLIAIESLQTAGALLVRPADSATKIRPRPMRTTLLGLVFGIVIGIGLAFLWEALDTRVRTAEEIEERLRLPLLARLPSLPRRPREQGATALLSLSDAAGPYAESIRTLRGRLDLARRDRGMHVLMVTSATRGEGKSTMVANLAVALAEAGRRVVLCDLDARRPVIGRFFGLEARAGLIDVALGQIELEHALSVVAIPDKPYWPRQQAVNGNSGDSLGGLLEVLTLGRTPADPAEFVGSDRVGEILERLRARADIVLVDAPALLDVGDAMTVSTKVDALLIVTRLDVIRRSMLSELHRVLASCPAPALGFVLTGVNVDDLYGYDSRYVYPVQAESERESVKQ
jgi:Mrp family chromosome partitioning ATPase/capsular polysaccharide biosynthesis protein